MRGRKSAFVPDIQFPCLGPDPCVEAGVCGDARSRCYARLGVPAPALAVRCGLANADPAAAPLIKTIDQLPVQIRTTGSVQAEGHCGLPAHDILQPARVETVRALAERRCRARGHPETTRA